MSGEISETSIGAFEITLERTGSTYTALRAFLSRHNEQAELDRENTVTDEMAIAFHSAKVGLSVDEVREAFETTKYVRQIILDWKPLIEAALKARSK